MPIVVTQPRNYDIAKGIERSGTVIMNEFTVLCPKCKTLETVWFTEDGLLVQTQKFSQADSRVYHHCGTREPCRLYRTA